MSIRNNEALDGPGQDPKRRKAWLLAPLLLLLLALGSCCAFALHSGTDSSVNSPASYGVGLTLDPSATVSSEDVAGETDDLLDSVVIPGWGEIRIGANTRTAEVDFYNPEENEGAFYLTFSLEIEEDGAGEVIWTSGLIEPGSHVREITLDRALEAGTYDAVVHVQPYRIDEGTTPTNNADMATKLVVSWGPGRDGP